MKLGNDVDYSLYNLDAEETVCSAHIKDDYINKFINSVGNLDTCSYCEKRRKVVSCLKF